MNYELLIKNKGFSLIELMVSVAIFSLVMVVGGAAVLNQNTAFKKTQHQREIIDNLSFVMEEMSRHLRLGSNYNCNPSLPVTDEKPNNCSSGAVKIAFEHVYGEENNPGDQWVYRITPGNEVQKSKAGGASGTFLVLTPPEIIIDSNLSGFTVEGAFNSENPPDDLKQPRVIIRLAGEIIYKSDRTPFNIQTTISQRLLDS